MVKTPKQPKRQLMMLHTSFRDGNPNEGIRALNEEIFTKRINIDRIVSIVHEGEGRNRLMTVYYKD